MKSERKWKNGDGRTVEANRYIDGNESNATNTVKEKKIKKQRRPRPCKIKNPNTRMPSQTANPIFHSFRPSDNTWYPAACLIARSKKIITKARRSRSRRSFRWHR